MAVWQNSFDGTPGTNLTVANSSNHGDPINGLRNSPPANSVRYGDRAIMGASSLRLGTPDAETHGDVWLYEPTVNAYSVSFYLYLTEGGWVRLRGADGIADLYLATTSQSYLAGHAVPQEVMDELYDTWVRVESIVSATELGFRLYWTDIGAPGTEAAADYTHATARDGGTAGEIFAQGGTGENIYLDQIRIGEGEWLGPWPQEIDLSASATLTLSGSASITADRDDTIVWQNSFDGPDRTPITIENSGDHGDELLLAADPVAYSSAWSAAGTASAMVGPDDALSGLGLRPWTVGGSVPWALRLYVMIPQGEALQVVGLAPTILSPANFAFLIVAEETSQYTVNGFDATEYAGDLVGQTLRLECTQASAEADIVCRVWWVDPYGTGPADLEVTRQLASNWALRDVQVTAPAGLGYGYVDEIAVADTADWIGPVEVTDHTLSASATLPLSGSAEIRADLDDIISASATLPLSGSADVARHGRVDAGATLPLTASATITRHATVAATGTLGELSAPPVDITREGRFAAGATLPLAAHPAEFRTQFRPTFPPVLTTEILLDGQWVDITGDVRASEPVHITRGRADEAAQLDPSALSLLLNNRHGRYSTHNPLSPYYGSLGKNTPIRIRVGPMPDTPEADLVDTFDRDVSDGWGTADTGQDWVAPFDEDTVTYTVADGAGHQTMAAVNVSANQITDEDVPADLEVTYATSVSETPRGQAGGAIYSTLRVRGTPAGDHYRLGVSVRADAGAVGSALRVAADISLWVSDSSVQLTPIGAPVPGLAYTPGQWLRVRAQAVGPMLRMRVWADGEPEPQVWHAQAWHERLLEDGHAGPRAIITQNAQDTQVPTTVSFRDLDMRPVYEAPDVIRFSGEVTSWPVRWDLSDSDVWVPLPAAGILRRLGQGAKPLRSPLRRTLPLYFPVAYWPMEDGAEATQAASPVPGVAPLRVSGMDMAAETSLVSSGPLPTLGEVGRMTSGSIPSTDTGSWEVDLLFYVEEPDDGWDGNQRLLSVQTSGFTIDLDVFHTSGRPALRRTVTNGSGTEVHTGWMNTDTGNISFFDAWRRLRLYATQDGGSVACRLDWIDQASSQWGTSFSFSGQVGRVTGITTAFGDELDGLSLGHITVWGTTAVAAYGQPFPGFSRESARDRLSRLSAGAEVPVEIFGAASERLGPEPEGAFLDVLAQAQEADLGAPGEARDHLGLVYRGRDAVYNQLPAVVFDYASGEISAPFEPEDDDQALRNDVEVSRSDGSSFQVEDRDGPLGTRRVGRYDESVTLNLASDLQVAAHAGWRLHLGTVDELRWPSIRINLANPRLSARVEDIIGLDAGDRIRVLNPPPWAQERALDLIVQGYEESIGLFQWEMTLTCTPASPWAVAEMAEDAGAPPDARMRADTAGSALEDGVDEDATVLEVATTTGPRWVTTTDHPDSLPFDITVGGEIMRVTGIADDDGVQVFDVERALNRIRKAHPSGAPVRLAYPAVTAL